MKRAFLMAVLAAVCGVACAQEDTNLYWKIITLPPDEGGCAWCRAEKRARGEEEKDTSEDAIRFVCTNSMTTWPAGSVIVCPYDNHDQLIVRNTKANVKKLEDYLAYVLGRPEFEVEVTALAVRKQDVETLSAQGGVTCEALMGLRTKGLCKQIASYSTVLKRGGAAGNLAEQMMSYPTKLECVATTNDSCAAVSLVPAGCETQGLGYRVSLDAGYQCSPDDNIIRLNVEADNTTFQTWNTFDALVDKKGGMTAMSFKLPVFDRSGVEAWRSLRSGEVILLGGGGNESQDWFTYHFLRATVKWEKALK